jgi:hypothetical protein
MKSVASVSHDAVTAYNLPGFQPPPKAMFSHSEGVGITSFLFAKRFVTKKSRSFSKVRVLSLDSNNNVFD